MKKATKSSRSKTSTKAAAKSKAGAKSVSKKVSSQELVIDVQTLIIPVSILLAGLIIGVGAFFGLRSANVKANSTAVKGQTAQVTDQATGAATITLDQTKDIFKKDFIKFGNEKSKLLLVEFGDPSCPYCHIASGKNAELNKSAGSQFIMKADGGTYVAPVPEFKKLVDSGKASFAYVYTTGHGNGKLAMQALYCAYDKGKFWEAHDLLMSAKGYTMQNDTVQNDVKKSGQMADFLASAVDKNFMKSCLESEKYADRVNTDEQYAGSLGVSGTPGFLVNDKLFAGAYSFTSMQSSVSELN